MANRSIDKPLIVIVGPTASGKTGLALRIAQKYDGEIIAADSRTLYRGLDIGTAKPTKEEQGQVPHWGIDLIDPGERYSAAQFQQYANQAIKDIRQRGKTPLLVGGTGLYINAVIYDYEFVSTDQSLKSQLEALNEDQLQEYCLENNINLPENQKNKFHLVNQILRQGRVGGRKLSPLDNTYVVGITTESSTLKQRIHKRALEMFNTGVAQEANSISSRLGKSTQDLPGSVYKVLALLSAGEISRDEVVERFATLDWQLARRQMTWFKRDPNIKWLQLDAAEHYLDQILAPEY